jgi:hypothetical protein
VDATSYWADSTVLPRFANLKRDTEVDVVVIGSDFSTKFTTKFPTKAPAEAKMRIAAGGPGELGTRAFFP